MSQQLTAVVLTYNEAEHITACLESLAWADQRLVFDSFSTDQTVNLARRAGAEVLQHTFVDYGRQRNAALQAVDTEWLLFVDADERIPPELSAEIIAVLNSPENGWWIPRHNYIFGKLTNAAGWWPDYQLRLIRPQAATYDQSRPVHETVKLQGQAGHLQTPMVHYNYKHVAQFHAKQDHYTDFEAQRRYDEGMRPKLYSYLWLPFKHFVWRFLKQKGFRLGWHGLRLSLMMAWYEYLTWVRVERLWRAFR